MVFSNSSQSLEVLSFLFNFWQVIGLIYSYNTCMVALFVCIPYLSSLSRFPSSWFPSVFPLTLSISYSGIVTCPHSGWAAPGCTIPARSSAHSIAVVGTFCTTGWCFLSLANAVTYISPCRNFISMEHLPHQLMYYNCISDNIFIRLSIAWETFMFLQSWSDILLAPILETNTSYFRKQKGQSRLTRSL